VGEAQARTSGTEVNQIGARGEDGEAEAPEVMLDQEVKQHWDDRSSPFVPRNILQVTYCDVP
jgi:hypothetical protein